MDRKNLRRKELLGELGISQNMEENKGKKRMQHSPADEMGQPQRRLEM